MTPIGEILAYPATTAPLGFLVCDGSAVSRTVYSALFSIIGTTFGSGDGSTTFNLPNLKGRVVVGHKSSDADFDAVGETGGSNTINIAHSHTQIGHTHTFSGTLTTTGSQAWMDNGSNAYFGSTAAHTHTVSGTSGAASDLGTSSTLSSAQSILNPYVTFNFIIRAKINTSSFLFNVIY